MGENVRFSEFTPTYDSYTQWRDIVSEGTWQVVSPGVLSDIIPPKLLAKVNSVMVMGAASANGSVFVANLNRIDKKDNAVDQQPYIAVFNHNTSSASGGFVDHGNWRARTTILDMDSLSTIAASGIDAYIFLSEMPSTASGLLDELEGDSSQNAAFKESILALKKRYKR